MTVFNPSPKRYQKISLVQIDTKKSLINPNRFIAENDKASMEAQPYIAKIRKAYDRACADLQKLS